MGGQLLDDLLPAARAGAPEPLARLCMLFYPKVLTYMRYRVDVTSADDLAAEVFLRVVRHIREQNGSFVAWLYRIAANVVVDHARRAARKEASVDDDILNRSSSRTAGTVDSDRRMDLESALARLTDDQRELIALKFIQGLSNEEIAESTTRSPEAVRALQFRALVTLRGILDGPAEGGSP